MLSSVTTKAIACSKSVRDFMIKDRKVKPDILEILLYGLPLSQFQAPDIAKVQEIKKAWGLHYRIRLLVVLDACRILKKDRYFF